MNKKVWTAMLVLTVVFLGFLYVAKIFFPQEFVMCIEDERLIQIGSFIDNHKWASYVVGALVGCIFDYFYFGAITRKLKIDYKLIVCIIIYNLSYNALFTFIPKEHILQYNSLFMILSNCYMILLPCLFSKELLPLSITYTINSIAQLLSLEIRGISLLMTNANSITMLLMVLEAYLWVVLCFIVFNYKKEE